jgi:hypothetical protein
LVEGWRRLRGFAFSPDRARAGASLAVCLVRVARRLAPDEVDLARRALRLDLNPSTARFTSAAVMSNARPNPTSALIRRMANVAGRPR